VTRRYFLILSLLLAGCNHAVVPDRPVDPLVEARNLTKAGRAAEAYDRFKDILDREPDNLTAHRGLVEAAYYAGKLSEATGRYRKLSKKKGSEGLGHYGLGLCEVAQGPGHMQAALKKFKNAAGLMPKESDVPYRIGLVYLMNGEHEKARDSLARAMELDPDRADVRVALAGALVRLGKEQEAIEVMRKILRLSPTSEVARKARTLTSQVYDPLKEASPEVAQDLAKVVDLLHQDAVQQALLSVEKVLKNNPQNPFAYSLKGLAHSRLENNGEAIVAFERALELKPKSPVALVGLGDVYARLEKWPQAREYYEKAVGLDPFDLEAHKRMGEMALARGDHDWAARCYTTLVLLDSENLAHRHQLGRVLVKADRLQEAVAAYEGILQISPDDLESLVRLGSLHVALGEREPLTRTEQRRRARQYLEKAHELNPDNHAVTEMLSQLEN
jgi:tetratricopeptide (TPR) repeat protein